MKTCPGSLINAACRTTSFLRRKLVSRLESGYSRFELTDSFRRVPAHTIALREMRAAGMCVCFRVVDQTKWTNRRSKRDGRQLNC